jgi:hypothetical protein
MAPITVEEMSHPPKAMAVHVGPVAGEVSYDVVEKLRSCCDFMSLDPQGLVRRFDEAGNVSLGPLMDRRLLDHVDIFKSSLVEIQAVTGLSDLDQAMKAVHDYGVKIVIVTLGANGAAVSVEDAIHNVPAFKPVNLLIPLGLAMRSLAVSWQNMCAAKTVLGVHVSELRLPRLLLKVSVRHFSVIKRKSVEERCFSMKRKLRNEVYSIALDHVE